MFKVRRQHTYISTLYTYIDVGLLYICIYVHIYIADMNYAIPTFSKISTLKLFIIPTQMRHGNHDL